MEYEQDNVNVRAGIVWRGLVPIETTVLAAMLDGKTACGHCKPIRDWQNNLFDA